MVQSCEVTQLRTDDFYLLNLNIKVGKQIPSSYSDFLSLMKRATEIRRHQLQLTKLALVNEKQVSFSEVLSGGGHNQKIRNRITNYKVD